MKPETVKEKLRIYAYCCYMNDIRRLSHRPFYRKIRAVFHTITDVCREPGLLRGEFFSYIEMPLTTNCTLKCKGCANLMPYYSVQPFPAKEELLDDIDRLLNAVRGIGVFGVLGGEPLLYPQIDAVLEKLLYSERVGLVEIVTNGTVWPKESTIDLMKNPKTVVRVSDYGSRSVFLNQWKECGDIRVRVLDSKNIWNDFGELIRKNKTDTDVEEQFLKCDSECCSYFHGSIYCCPRAGHGRDLGVIRVSDDEVARIRTAKTREEAEEEIRKLKRIRYSEACYYCNKGTEEFRRIRYE